MDIFFLSFNEPNREVNWRILKSRFPKSGRIHGVTGVALAHQMCAKLSKTPFFFVVNGDNEVKSDFNFQPPKSLTPAVYTWRSFNPVNGLVYGFGGIKLFWKSSDFSFGSDGIDVSTSLGVPYKIIRQTASITRFNSSALSAYRGAFRECVKLSARCISGQKDEETEHRLNIWCERGRDKPFGQYSLMGAKQGKAYGLKYRECPSALKKINDFKWLETRFLKAVSKP